MEEIATRGDQTQPLKKLKCRKEKEPPQGADDELIKKFNKSTKRQEKMRFVKVFYISH